MDVPILMYHRVCEDRVAASSPYVVRASVFERQLAWLAARGFRGVRATEIADRAPRPGERTIVITFDDGYLDNHAVAFPLLRRYGFPATIFLVGDFRLGKNTWDHGIPEAGAPLLAEEHVREMAAAGIAFGAHGVSHRSLVALDDATAYGELTRSREVLGELLGTTVDSLAYPYGHVDRRTKALARRAGYRTAFAVNSGPLHVEDDPLEIRRVTMGDSAGDLYMLAKVTGIEKRLRAQRPAPRAHVPLVPIANRRTDELRSMGFVSRW